MDGKQNFVLQVEGVTRIFDENFVALQNVSFAVNEGDFVVIAGSNGSGKSVLMSLIARLDDATSGTVRVKEGAVGLVFQDADAQILGETPLEDVLFGVRMRTKDKARANELALNALKNAGLLHKKDSPARLLSGGEKRRLAVAGIVALDKSIIIFDEPFANLDWRGVVQVNHILQELKQTGKTVIVLTHELEKVLALANRFIVLDKGVVRFDGSVQDGLKAPLEDWSIRNPLKNYERTEDLLWL